MSLSRPTKQANYKKEMYGIVFDPSTDTAFANLHWSEQLKLRPLRSQVRREYNRDGDYDNRLDNWDDPENYEESNESI